MSCPVTINDAKVGQALKKRFGTNEAQAIILWNKVVKNGEFTPEFQEWQKEKRKTDEVVTLETANSRTIVNDIISYYNRTTPDGNETVLDYGTSTTDNYGSASDRRFCQRIVGSEMLDYFRKLRYELGDFKKHSRNEYIQTTTIYFIQNRVSSYAYNKAGLTKEEFKTKIDRARFAEHYKKLINEGLSKEEATPYAAMLAELDAAEELLGKDLNEQEKNLIATAEEMLDFSKMESGVRARDMFFSQIMNDPRLDEVRHMTDATTYAAEDNAQQDEDNQLGTQDGENDGESESLKDVFDVSFRVFDSHSGMYNTFTTHIGGNIKSYLNSLRKLSGTGRVNGNRFWDTNNCIGIADTMNANECAMVLYTQGNYTNVASMIQSIKDIADRVPGFEAFAQFAEDLEANYDFAYEVYTTFGKMVIAKTETYIENGEVKSRITNTNANKRDALRFEYINSLRSSSLSVNETIDNEKVNKLRKAVNDIKKDLKQKVYDKDSLKYKKYLNEAIADLYSQLKKYYPTIDQTAVLRYVTGNKVNGAVNELDNLGLLIGQLSNTIYGAVETSNNYYANQAVGAEIRKKNNALKNDGQHHEASEFGDEYEAWNREILSDNSISAAINLANELVAFSLVKTELNHRNAEGKLSSSVINSSYITNFMNILKSELNSKNNQESPINNFAKYKFRSKQYDLSNILIEKREGSTIINYGLFRINAAGEYVPTDYASELIEMSLFNGASDYGSGKAILYSAMSQGDYFATALANFRATKTVHNNTIEVAQYFMRVPSDAPKNFMFTAPVYRLNNFFNIENENAMNSHISSLIKGIKKSDDDSHVSLNNSNNVSQDIAIQLLSGEEVNSITIKPKTIHTIEDRAYTSVESEGTTIVISGTKGYVNGRTVINNARIEHVYDDGSNVSGLSDETEIALQNYYRKQLITGKMTLADGSKVVRRVNRNHPIFRQMQNVFRQEMQNAATAIDKLFTHENGVISFDRATGNPVWSPTFAGKSNPDRDTYANYHHKNNEYKKVTFDDGSAKDKVKESGVVQNHYEEIRDDNGNVVGYRATGLKRLSGNVFSSDRFTLYDDENGVIKNYLADVLDEGMAREEDGKIHILYGGANTHLHLDSDGNVVLTEAQQRTVDDKIEEFIIDYINDSVERASNFENLTENITTDPDDIAEFALNYRLAYFNANDIFEGDTKFYKSAQDFLKRTKEVQGSGVPYGITDFSKPLFGQVHVPVVGARLNSPEIQDELKGLNNCKQFTTFRAVTVKNTVRTSKESQDILVKQLIDIFRNNGMTIVEATEKAKAMMEGYQNTKVNDAQSYITFEEWIRRISARGQLGKYMPLIKEILDRSKPLSTKTIDEFIQVQKNFYYDMVYDEATGVMAPRQIKNAEFVLVPRLIEGTELEEVYNTMIKHGIDQLNTEETSKAGKAKVLTLWNNDGKLTQDWLDDFNDNIASAIETFDYNYLYTQQETPQHVNSENKAGIQIMKKIIDNITEKDEHLWNVKQDFLKQYSANIYDSFANVMAELEIPLNEDGNIELNVDAEGNKTIAGVKYDVFLDKLKDEMMRLGLDSNMMDYVTLDDIALEDKAGDAGVGMPTKMKPYLNSVGVKLESICQSVFNNAITRQKLPGFHAAQITNVGWETYVKKNGKKMSEEVSNRAYSKELKYHPDGERYIEVMLPANNFGFDRNDAKYDNIRERAEKEGWSTAKLEQEIDGAMIAELRAKKLDTIIGYRIPTEGKQSVCVMKVVGFTPDAYGSTIVVPDDWVAQTGSDFDIDSVYGIQYSTRQTKDGIQKIEYSSNPKENYLSYILPKLDKETRKTIYAKAKLDKEDREAIIEENANDEIAILNAIDAERKDNLLTYANYEAKKAGLMSFDQFKEKPEEYQNSREARNNRILDDMIEILQSDAALEENLSQSQFGDVIAARDKIIDTKTKIKRNGRSPFDFFDQAEYQEDAMSGAKLKAFSVTRDTFCSICNTVRPELAASVDIVYHGDNKTFKRLQKRFDKKDSAGHWLGYVEDLGNGKILVKHTMFGHSNDNKNVDGKILTAYSSQTTAHILDAIKEGAIPNVNDLTFGVYKIFPDLGSNYDMAVSFMMQPGVSAIVQAYNKNKSIYARGYKNPVNAAIKQITKNIEGITKNMTIDQIDDTIKKYMKANDISFDNVLDYNLLTARINNDESIFTSPVEASIFDYLVIQQYKNLDNLASKIGDLTRVCNPDKFGAKQTIFATNKIFETISDIINDDYQIFDKKNNKHFLEQIYPGISKGIDAYIQSTDNNSAYPPLHYFLKYASATSVKVNRMLFVTQQPNFIAAVNTIRDVMSGSKKEVTEATYNDFEKYIISDLYASVHIIGCPVTYVKGQGIQINTEGAEQERNRIFGYDYPATTKIRVPKTVIKEKENGETEEITEYEEQEFNPVDINDPTDDEIAQFAKFTPAQKVFWIQEHFRDGLVTKYIKASLYNSNEYRKNVAGSQTLEFIEDGKDMENIYEEFRKTFMNNNPLLALTAMDIIKYAFIVEGYRMKRSAVNKVIDNDVLTNDRGLYGTGIMTALDSLIRNISDLGSKETEYLCEQYVRSHSNMREISHTFMSNKDRGDHTRTTKRGVIVIPRNKDFITEHGIGYIATAQTSGGTIQYIIPNSYIKIKFEKNREGLYKIIQGNKSGYFYLAPMNLLQENECVNWSSNRENSKYNHILFYEDAIEKYESTYESYNIDNLSNVIESMANEKEYQAPKREISTSKRQAVPFDINDDKSYIIKLRDQVIDHFDGENGSPLVVENIGLHKHITDFGVNNGVKFILDGTQYIVYRVPTNSLFRYTTKNGLKKPIAETHRHFTDVINAARQRGIDSGHAGEAHVNEAYMVMPVTETSINRGERHSTVTEDLPKSLTKADKLIRREARNSEEEASIKYVKQMTKRGIESTSKAIANNIEDTIISTAEYVTSAVERVLNGNSSLNAFMTDPETGEILSITDAKVYRYIKADPGLRRQYLRTLLDAQKLINTFGSYGTLKVQEDNPRMRFYRDKIAEAINKLQENSILDEAERLFVTEYLASTSTNPNIQDNIISLLDGFHSTNVLTAYLNDLQETTNPMIQLITSEVMADIRAKEFAATERIREFKAKVAEIKEKARKNGRTIDWKNIVDEYGNFINDYSEAFTAELEAKTDKIDELKKAYKAEGLSHYDKAIAYEKYLQAQLDFDKWLLKNTNQKLKDSYYIAKIKNQESMINADNGKFMDIYVEYRMLNEELSEVFDHAVGNELDPVWEARKQEILEQLTNLKSDAVKLPTGDYAYKRDLEEYEISRDPATRRQQNIYSRHAAKKLRDFIEQNRNIDNYYYERTERFGFREQLKKNLQTIARFEKRSPITGQPTVPESELAEIPAYVEAKKWVKHNAYYDYRTLGAQMSNEEAIAKLKQAFEDGFDPSSEEFAVLLNSALTFFKNSVGERGNKKAIYKLIAANHDARDEYGVIDARDFTEDEIKAIKDEQERRFGIGEDYPLSERSIIHNSTSDDTIYTAAFYQGLNVGGLSNPEYLKVVKQLNDILKYALNTSTGVLETSKLSVEQLQDIVEIYKKLGYNATEQEFNTSEGIKKKTGVKRSDVDKVTKFIRDNVEFVLSTEDKARFNAEKAEAKAKGKHYYRQWSLVNEEWNDDTHDFVPNHLLWGHAQPKSTLSPEERSKFIDKTKTAAVRIINTVFTETATKYYDYKKEEMIATHGEDSAAYKEWFDANHVYNPSKHMYEPLPCWTKSEPNEYMPGEWTPTYNMTDKSPKEKNSHFKENLGIASNYKTSADRRAILAEYDGFEDDDPFSLESKEEFAKYAISNGRYDRVSTANEEEKELKQYVQEVLTALAKNKQAKRYLAQGHLPSRAKAQEKSMKRVWLEELAKGFGWMDNSTAKRDWKTEVNYDSDYVPKMPMLEQLKTKDSVMPPIKRDDETAEQYQARVKEYEEHKKENQRKNADIHKSLLDNNWEDVIEEFISKAAHYNAIQDNKYALYFGQKLINDFEIYQTKYGRLRKNGTLSNDDETIYQTKKDKHLQEQYSNWIRRVIFDQYKEYQGKKTRIMNIIQSFTSVEYMTFNIKGGIANITVGESNILGEAFAKEYFNVKDWAEGKRLWASATVAFAANMYSETSTNLIDAIIKGMNIVDYDEVTGRVSVVGMEKWSKRLRDSAFAPQTIGEHFMQNGAMLSMMVSHRLVDNPNYGEPGEPKYIAMNQAEYMRDAAKVALESVLTDADRVKYAESLEQIKQNKNLAKEVAQFRTDPISKFVLRNLTSSQQQAFIKAREEHQALREKDFVKYPKMIDQFELGKDGKMTFKSGSRLDEMNVLTGNQEVSDAYKALGKFKGRVISVNKKIHGNYGKLDSAMIERGWLGGLVMQYHKHIVPGIMKRWRREGYYNEERGTVEKGSYVAVYDWLKTPIDLIAEKNKMSDAEKESLVGIQNIFSMITDYVHYARLTYNVLPEHERANIRRNWGDLAGMAIAVLGAFLLRLGYDDDDDSFVYNLGLYEMDRLASETFMWNPLGAYAEAKKLWSSPIAAQSIFSDILNVMGTTAGIIFEGDEYDPYFRSGRYAGQSKIAVYTERRIPYWRNYVALRDIADNNHYYKLGDNMLSILPIKDLANKLKK